jgi:hypothetical protein
VYSVADLLIDMIIESSGLQYPEKPTKQQQRDVKELVSIHCSTKVGSASLRAHLFFVFITTILLKTEDKKVAGI